MTRNLKKKPLVHVWVGVFVCFLGFFFWLVGFVGFFSYGTTIVAKILETVFCCFFGEGGGLVLVLTLEYKYYVV